MFTVLTEPHIRIGTEEGARHTSLPEVYAALVMDQVEAFPALRPHQRHAWHAFLVQLGAMAMHRAGITEPPVGATVWEALIRGLTPDFPDDEPWQLVVEDITKPAFMQPPASSPDKAADYKSMVATPDELDMLVTSKNHDLKASVGAHAGVDDWIFALVTLQTMEGFGGAGNYGVSRMNGGLGSRPAFSLAPSARPGAHVRRDIIALLSKYPVSTGTRDLLWTVPWDGTSAERLLPHQLAPFYIEVCRRVRLRSDEDGRLHCIRTSSKAARIEGKDIKGRTGDPWTPHNPNRDGLPLTLSGGGFDYRRVTEYLTNWARPELMNPTQSDHQLIARGMVRGQGKTEGYHERIIPLKPKTVQVFGRASNAPGLGDIAKERVAEVGKIKSILRHAISTFAARGESNDASPEQRARANPWSDQLDEIVDSSFFDSLQEEFVEDDDSERDAIRNKWLMNGQDGIIDHARNILHNATDSLPCPAIHRYRARVNAVGLFEGRIRGNSGLPFLFANSAEENA